MKVKIEFRALCPYKIDDDGTEHYNRYSKEYDAREIKVHKNGDITIYTEEHKAEAFTREQIEETVYITE